MQILQNNCQVLFVFQKLPSTSTAAKKAAGISPDSHRLSGIKYDSIGNILNDVDNMLEERPNY